MPAVTPSNAVVAEPAARDQSNQSNQDLLSTARSHAEGDIRIEYLDHSMAYAVPTWCSTSLLA